MRAIRGYWVCTAALAAGDSESSNPDNLRKRIDAEQVIITVVTSESIVGGQGVLEIDDGIQLREGAERSIVVVTTTQSAVTIAYPKKAEAPLFKRKLGSNRWDIIHEGIQGQKRDATQCPADYQLCPKSLNGGCCPNDRVCGSSSCLPTSTAPASACGKLGYVACGMSDGGGCCPSGYACGQLGCSPSAGVSYSQTCGVESYLCPASFNYGCCKKGMGCALNGCYATSITTFTVTETFTTTDASSNPHTITSTILTAATPSVPTATASNEANLVPKLPSTVSAIAKVDATGSPSTGMSTPVIGGIIGASVAFLIIILIAATLIIRRLNTAIKISATSNSRTSSSGPRTGQPHAQQIEGLDVDAMSIDPLMMTGSEAASSVRHPSHQSNPHSSAHEVEANSPPLFHSPFTPYPPPHTHYPRGYNPVAASESNYSQSSSAGYFDLPIQSNHRDSQGSGPTRRPSQHGRNWSNASDQSQVSQVSSEAAELEATSEGGSRWGIHRALSGLGMGRMVSRRRSDNVALIGGPNRPTPASPVLGHIPEASESQHRVDLLGHVGARGLNGVQGLSGVQLREAGLSNSQLREMTMSEVSNPYASPTERHAPDMNEKQYG
ncbi:uncharacterized protein BP5553_07386 [Venustampulla echinocandica]|uniref:Uncharacterized protein n=1 Tax=Venustampulla echinocandica TaxID=2656787 RepID=A0A370TJC3_9HELO|nr:uncharacterized protein BP5553_07386 [Venustampulla echinocandica]RDL35455.1 hypothetical protein BP5553_07386 [Venustampulla echinocandica]